MDAVVQGKAPVIEEQDVFTFSVRRDPPSKSGVVTVSYRCPFCGARHIHGWPDDAASGLRLSHCDYADSPYQGKQMLLVLSDEDGG